jgi:hypothetical protein
MFAGAGISAVGNIMGLNARGNAAEAKAHSYEVQAQQDRDTAELQVRQANLDVAAGGYAASRKEQQLGSLEAKQEVAVAASGFTLSGTPTDVILDSRKQGELDAQAIQYGSALKFNNAILRSDSLRNKALDEDYAASVERSSKPGALDYALGIGKGLTSVASNDRITRLGTLFGKA